MISIDQDGNVSVIEEIQELEEQDNINEDIITIEAWQWIVLIFGLIVMFLIIRSSLANVQY
ncbi:MAG: hypothetical protein GPJ54_15925 [Candidatus Heimdallarchaeota archaeon]|nr:hypothetical protein [Candidatus Heimdallarchaeota archaeon]